MESPIRENPRPVFSTLEAVIRGDLETTRVPLVELFLDQEVLQFICRECLGRQWIAVEDSIDGHYQLLCELYLRLGYDYVPIHHWHNFLNQPVSDREATRDTAQLSRGERSFVVSGHGLIRSWEDFEKINWDAIKPDFSAYEPVIRHLPDGMKIVVETTFFQNFVDVLFGYDGLGIMLHDDPDLVAVAFEKWGEITVDLYKTFMPIDEVGAVFHADDLGFKTNTFLPRHVYRQHLYPWLKKLVEIAHGNNKTFWLHCCGNVYANGTIDDLIDELGIDAFHSFQDSILPVTQFVSSYGKRCAALGGVDMDKLCRMNEPDLRAYVRAILETCMPGGRFGLGSGNSVTNYTPVENYAIMIDEARRW